MGKIPHVAAVRERQSPAWRGFLKMPIGRLAFPGFRSSFSYEPRRNPITHSQVNCLEK
jgi:hypothetical protein